MDPKLLHHQHTLLFFALLLLAAGLFFRLWPHLKFFLFQ